MPFPRTDTDLAAQDCKKEYIYAWCCECGNPLPGIHRKGKRRCIRCYKKTLRGFSLNQGYIRLRGGRKEKKRYLHDVIMESLIGRPLTKGEVVHHVNGNKADNRPENLRLYENPGSHVLEEGHVVIGRGGKFTCPNAQEFRK